MGRNFKEILEEVWPDYVLGKSLGQGSFAAVYEAHRRDGVAVSPSAIKVISVPTSENEVEELRMEGLTGNQTEEYFQSVVDDYKREIKLMDALRTDPHVVNIEDYKVCKVPGEMLWYIFIRMPRLTPLRTEMEKWTEDELEEKVVRMGTDLCKALESCRRFQIIHRDIKPENIFVTPQGDFRLGDFGVARNLGQTTRGLSRRGTPNYMAPELYKGEAIRDFRYAGLVDQYSLGMVLYYVANGMCLPFYPRDRQVISADTRDASFIRRINGDALPPPEKVSRGLGEVILKALSYKPEDRYATPEEMLKALEGYTRESRDLPLSAAMDKWTRDEIGTRVAGLGIDLCGALEDSRTSRILPDDIRPENIYVSPEGKCYFGDSGTAAAGEDRTVIVKDRNAALEYISPEGFGGKSAGLLMEEQYALGMVLYYAANGGRLPFMAKEAEALSLPERDNANARRLRGDALPPPANASKELSAVILKALSHNPGDRYAGLKKMSKDLGKARDAARPAGSGGPAKPARPAGGGDSSKPARPAGGGGSAKPRRSRWPLIIAAVCLLAALGVGVWQLPNIRAMINNLKPVPTSAPVTAPVSTPTPAPSPTPTPTPVSTPTPTSVPTPRPEERSQTDLNALIMEKLAAAGLAWPCDETALAAAQKAVPELKDCLYVIFPGDLNNDRMTDARDAELMDRYLMSVAADASGAGVPDEKGIERLMNGDLDGDGLVTSKDQAELNGRLESLLSENPAIRDGFILARLEEEGLPWPSAEVELSSVLEQLPWLNGYLYVGKKGDINGDGIVNVQDYVILMRLLQGNDGINVKCYANGDLDGDWKVTSADLAIFQQMQNAGEEQPSP